MEVIEIVQEQESDEGDMSKEEIMGLMEHFTEGQVVEVRVSDDQGLGDSWFTAKVLKLVNQTAMKRILVVYERPPDVPRMIYVNVSLVRPVPIQDAPKQFLLNQVVDAFHLNGWQKGKIIEVHGDLRYTVYFPSSTREKCLDFAHKDLRIHQDWIGGTWVMPQDEDKKTKLDQVDIRGRDQAKENTFCDLSKTQVQCFRKNVVTEPPPPRTPGSDQQHCKRTKGKGWKCPSMASPGQIYCDKHRLERDMYNKKRRKGRKEESLFVKEDDKGQARIEDTVFKSPTVNSSGTQMNPGSMELGGVVKTQRNGKSLTQRNASSSELVLELGERKRKGSREVFFSDKEKGIKEENGLVRRQSEDPTCQTSNTSREIHDVFLTEHIPKTEIIVTEKMSNGVDVQPLSTWSNSEESLSLATADKTSMPDHQLASQPNVVITSGEASNTCQDVQTKSDYNFYKASEDGQNETVTQTLLFDHNSDEITARKDKLPFVKSHPAWGIVESSEFHSLPQYPHFRPLQQRNEFLREGEAVGYMISFSNIVEETKRAQLEGPKSSLVNKLNALPELEAMGLDVQQVRAQLCKLLSAKDEHLQLEAELSQLEEEVLQGKHVEDLQNLEMDKIDKEIEELEDSIDQMKRKLQRLLMVKQIHKLREKIHETSLRFNRVATAPW